MADPDHYVVTIPVSLELLLPALKGEGNARPLRLQYTIREAAQLLAVSVDALRRMIDRGEIGVVHEGESGRAVRVPHAELERHVVEKLTRVGGHPWQAGAGTTRAAGGKGMAGDGTRI